MYWRIAVDPPCGRYDKNGMNLKVHQARTTEMERDTHIHVRPMPKKAPDITGAIQWVLLAVQANQNKEIYRVFISGNAGVTYHIPGRQWLQPWTWAISPLVANLLSLLGTSARNNTFT